MKTNSQTYLVGVLISIQLNYDIKTIKHKNDI